MDEFEPILSCCPLFEGIRREEMAVMLSCLGGKIVTAAKGSPVFLEGDPARYVGVLLDGKIQIVRDDYYGKRSVLTVVSPGGYFGEAFACAGLESLPVSALAVQNSTVLLLDCARMLTGCAETCTFHSRLVHNLLRCLAQKNLLLTRKIRCMAPRTPREKLLEIFLQWKQLLADALLVRAGFPGGPEATALARQRTAAQLAEAAGAVQTAMDHCAANVGAGHICGWLTAALPR